MRIYRLTTSQIRHAKPGLLHDGGGLMLQTTVGKEGHKNQSWLFRYSLPQTVISRNGRPRLRTRDMGLGPLATISVSEAREKARQLRQQRLNGIDPIEHRNEQRGLALQQAARIKTFEECALAYVSAHGVAWRSQKHADQWITSLQRFAFPVVGKLPVSQVDTPFLLRILQPIWTRTPETASRLRGRIEAVLNWATAGGFRAGDNPAEWNHLKFLLPASEKLNGGPRRLEAMPYGEIAAFMTDLRKVHSSAARALEFTILTGTRSNEIRGARWDEIGNDPETGLDAWVVPGSRTKSGRLHRVPLSEAALAVLERQRGVQRNDLVFPGQGDGRLGDKAMLGVIELLGRKVTVHGFRATFRTWTAERTSFPREICEVALGHTVGDETERAYQRGDQLIKRRELMEKWAQFCATPFVTTKVTPIRAVS